MTICPGCGSTDVLPGRIYCRPSCKVQHEYLEREQRPNLFDRLSDWHGSERPGESKPTGDRSGSVNPASREVG
jgi:hypothetical protein